MGESTMVDRFGVRRVAGAANQLVEDGEGGAVVAGGFGGEALFHQHFGFPAVLRGSGQGEDAYDCGQDDHIAT